MDVIIFKNNGGGLSVITPSGPIEKCMKDIPQDAEYKIVDLSSITSDRTFRGAWEMGESGLNINIDKSKLIAHDKRREKRTKLMMPFDKIISRQIPGTDLAGAEANRVIIREEHASIQTEIDNASDIESLKLIIENNDL